MLQRPDTAVQGRDGALAALEEAAADADRGTFGRTIDSFEPEDYEQIVALAWRYQFDDDRSRFKREIRELQQHVCDRIVARMELGE